MNVSCESIRSLSSTMSERTYANISVKQEASVQLEQDQDQDQDMNESLYSASTKRFNQAEYLLQHDDASSVSSIEIPNRQNLINMNSIENKYETSDEKTQVPKKDENKPVVHRNTGKISVENFRRRYHRQLTFTSNRRHSGNLPPNNQPSYSTMDLTIEPASSPNVLVLTQTTPASPTSTEEELIELSDGEEEEEENNNSPQQQANQSKQPEEQQQQQQQQRPSPGPILIGSTMDSIFNTVPQIINALNRHNKTVYCDVCEQRYASRGSYAQHVKSAKHKKNLEEYQRFQASNQDTNDQ